MTAPVLGDVLGPRGRKRVLVASVLSGALLAWFVLIAFRRLSESGQLAADKWTLFKDPAILRFLGKGLLTTLELAAASMALALVFGSLLALGRLAKNAPTRWLTGGWVEIFRAIPLLLMIYFSARGLPRLGLDLPGFWYVVAGLTLYNSAVLAEIFRSGILSLDRGQTEASMAIGMTYWQTMLLVVVPQAFRRMVPAIVSQLITLLKDTSLAFIVPIPELLRNAFTVGDQQGKPLLQALFVAAVMYIVVNFALSRLARRLEVRQRRRYGAGGIDVTGAEDLTAVNAAAERSAGL